MAELRLEFTADATQASRTINLLEKAIQEVTEEFKSAEIGSKSFLDAANRISQLTQEVNDAKNSVVNIERAQQQFNRALEAGHAAFGKAVQAADRYNQSIHKLADESYKEQKELRDKNLQDEQDDWNRRLQIATVASAKIARQQRAVMEFRAGMGARGAIPEVASPIRGSASQFGSPEYFEALNRDLEQAIKEGRLIDAEISKAADSREKAINDFRAAMGGRGAIMGIASPVRGSTEQVGSPAFYEAEMERQRARMEFRAGMGARGAIPEIASPIRGGLQYPGSPEYLAEMERAAKAAEDALNGVDAAARKGKARFDPRSLAAYEDKLKRLQKAASLIAPDTDQWERLRKKLIETEVSVNKLRARQSAGPSARARLGAAGGAFLYGGGLGGGIGSMVGGVAGGLMGGPATAFAGAAVGQALDTASRSIAGITSQAAAVQQMQRGLAMASIDAKDFAEAQSTVAAMSQKLLMPLEQTTRLFTQLRVNTKQYNLSVQDTAQIMEGTALAIAATGGSSEDLEGAMRAVVQILSKGGVQAEELRGQLGERFPGAVVKFAQANKLSFEELQEGLEEGRIGIKEFVAFAEKNYSDYADFSKQLATAPEFAGRRLQIAFEALTLELGGLFAPIGAQIQDALTTAIKAITNFVAENRVYIKQFISDWASIIGPIVKVISQLFGVFAKFAVEVGKIFQGLFSFIRQSAGLANVGEAKARFEKAKAAVAGKTRPTGNVRGGGPFTEYDQARAAFEALGGEAAFKRASQPLTPTNLTFGGPGANMPLERAGKDEQSRKKKKKELKEFVNDRIDTLRRRLEYEKAFIDADFDLTQRERDIAKARHELSYGMLIVDEQLANAQRDSLEIRTQDRARFLAEMQEQAKVEKNTLQAQFKISVAGGLVNENEQLADRYQDLALQLGNARQGVFNLTEAQKAELEITKITHNLKSDEINFLQGEIDQRRSLAGAIDELLPRLEKETKLYDLQNQLRLAQIIDPQAELREQLRQQHPLMQTGDIEELAQLQERIDKARSYKEQMQGMAQSISGSFGQAFKDVIGGAASAQQALSNLFENIADYFADMVAKMIAEWLKAQLIQGFMNFLGSVIPGAGALGSIAGGGFGSFSQPSSFGTGSMDLPGLSGAGALNTPSSIPSYAGVKFANGGIVTGPTLGLVGEGRYNEAIVPLPNGRSIPVELGGGMGGVNVVVNVDATGSEAAGNEGQAKALGNAISAAVQSEIIKQKRPGGLLAR